MLKVIERLLFDSAPSRVADAAERLAGEDLEQIGTSLPLAMAGDKDQVRTYVDAYGRLGDRLLEAVGDARPDLIVFDEFHRAQLVVKAKDGDATPPEPISWIRTVLQGEAMNAPFSDWVGSLDYGRGTALAMVELLRSILPIGKPLSRPAKWRLPTWDLGEGDVVRFYRAVADAIEGAEEPLERIRTVMGLSRTEAAALFGVRRQALDGWRQNGVPADRQAKVATVGAIADLLSTRLKSDRIPAVARRQAPAYGGRSILEAIEAGAEEEVLEALRHGFDWANAA
jgi:hypothetical protein